MAAFILVPLPALAERGGRRPMPIGPRLTPEQAAVAAYNEAVELTDKADRAEVEAAAQPDAARRDTLLRKARSHYEKAIKMLRGATEKKADLVSAFGQLGYAYRKTGAFDEALQAYARALALEPGYAPAIEYRAEAHLGLGRLEEAKEGYLLLSGMDRALADKLASAMRRWLDERRKAPGEVSGEALNGFEAWLNERQQVARQTTWLVPTGRDRW